MATRTAALVPLDDASGVGAARREATAIGLAAGLTEATLGNLALAITELGTNLVRHGGGGHLVVQATQAGVEVFALDKGRGMADVARCLEDGYSTGGTAGEGLGAVKRMSATFDVYSAPGKGTVIRCVVPRQATATPTPAGDHAGVSVAVKGETVCGDAWACEHADGKTTGFVIDGLGHGVIAHEAAREGLEAFRARPFNAPQDIMATVHGRLRKTRGAAAAVAAIDRAAGVVRFCGVGNIVAAVIAPDGQARRTVSHNGIVGHGMPKITVFEYPWTDRSLLLMHSDGVSGSWQLEPYPGLLSRHPALVAAVLFRDHRRERDDATVIASR